MPDTGTSSASSHNADAAPRRIGVLTGGGDCPGLNAVIRAVAKTAIFQHGWEVTGILDGFLGLIDNRMRPLNADSVSGILADGGTILGTSNRANPAHYHTGFNRHGDPTFEDVTDRCLDTIANARLDAIVAIGGDGTMAGCQPFVNAGVNVIGVPKTIDNDIVGTELTFGFQSAVAIATEALDRIHTTAASHDRVMIVEVMGRNAGWIALHAGVASGSDVILIPELPYSLNAVLDYIAHRRRIGRDYTIICVSEGARPEGGDQTIDRLDPTSPDPVRLGGVGEKLSREIERAAGQESRCAVLGHVQRGGGPIPGDRTLATELGFRAAELLASGERNRLVAVQQGRVTDVPIAAAAKGQRLVPIADDRLVAAARAVGTCFGDAG
jgi:6-phosphofructokinase 1